MWEYSHEGKQLENKWVFKRLQKTGRVCADVMSGGSLFQGSWGKGSKPTPHQLRGLGGALWAVMWSETVGLRTRPVWDQKNRSWSWSCRSGVVLWKTILSRSSSWSWRTQQLFKYYLYSFSNLCLEHHDFGGVLFTSLLWNSSSGVRGRALTAQRFLKYYFQHSGWPILTL